MLAAADIAALAGADHPDPFSVLGMHAVSGKLCVRAVLPNAESVEVIDVSTGRPVASLERVHPCGVFDGFAGRRRKPFTYRLRATWNGTPVEFDDPYRFPAVLGDVDVWLLAEGRHLRLQERLGAHPATLLGVDGVTFAVWAPNARRVAVVGDFNH